jgi:hypothetical protein
MSFAHAQSSASSCDPSFWVACRGRVSWRARSRKGPGGIVARDAKGNQVAAHTAVFNAFGNVSMVSAGGGIATLEFTNGNNEALLVQLCINVTTASG